MYKVLIDNRELRTLKRERRDAIRMVAVLLRRLDMRRKSLTKALNQSNYRGTSLIRWRNEAYTLKRELKECAQRLNKSTQRS